MCVILHPPLLLLPTSPYPPYSFLQNHRQSSESLKVKNMEGVDHLAHERSKAQFDVDPMKVVWAGSRHALELSDRIARLVATDPVIQFLILYFHYFD